MSAEYGYGLWYRDWRVQGVPRLQPPPEPALPDTS